LGIDSPKTKKVIRKSRPAKPATKDETENQITSASESEIPIEDMSTDQNPEV
jgi:hypothetical protein